MEAIEGRSSTLGLYRFHEKNALSLAGKRGRPCLRSLPAHPSLQPPSSGQQNIGMSVATHAELSKRHRRRREGFTRR